MAKIEAFSTYKRPSYERPCGFDTLRAKSKNPEYFDDPKVGASTISSWHSKIAGRVEYLFFDIFDGASPPNRLCWRANGSNWCSACLVPLNKQIERTSVGRSIKLL